MSHKVQYDKVYSFDLAGKVGFGTLTEKECFEILSDGRPSSHFLEVQLTKWFPELEHIKGCKDHDHVIKTGTKLVKIDAKNFTKSGGCKFMPSSMLGIGRTFNEKEFKRHANEINYAICDITRLPIVKVVFKKGDVLAEQYPKGQIGKKQRSVIFNE